VCEKTERKKKMKNTEQNFVRTFDKNGKMLYESEFSNADSAYAEYKDCIRILKKGNLKEEITVTRWRYGKIMALETLFKGC
jgi:antitoxin component YwqK of YwqJK toxin-antitoxin module